MDENASAVEAIRIIALFSLLVSGTLVFFSLLTGQLFQVRIGLIVAAIACIPLSSIHLEKREVQPKPGEIHWKGSFPGISFGVAAIVLPLIISTM